MTTTATAIPAQPIDNSPFVDTTVLGNWDPERKVVMRILSPDGDRVGVIGLPERPHNVAWGDSDRRALYVTAITSVYRIRLSIGGHSSAAGKGPPMSKGLIPGSVLTDFELPDETGTKHRLSELQGENVMVLMLGRGEHCPRERQHQREMLQFHQWCSVAFTELVTVLPNALHDLDKMKIATGAHWTYLADIDLRAQSALDIREYTDPHHDATVPHTVILSPGLVVEKAYVGYWFWGRPSAYQLWTDLQDLLRRSKPDFDPTSPEARSAWVAAAATPA